jgi:cytochrome P450
MENMREGCKRDIGDYSMLDEKVQDNPFEFYHLLQDACPVYQMPENGFYMITRYDDVRSVLRNAEVFQNYVPPSATLASNARHSLYQSVLREHGWPNVPTLQRCDGVAHKRYRKLVERVFSAQRVRELTPRIDELANLIIDRFIDRGFCEFVTEFALQLPGMFISEQLGLEAESVHTIKRWGDALTAMRSRLLSDEEIVATAKVELECQHHMAKIFEDRRINPQNDILSGLVHAHQADEEALSMPELQGLGAQLLAAGFETTMNAIAHGMLYLIRNPEQMRMLQADRALMPKFVDETLRIDSPNAGILRYTSKDAEVAGTTIPKDSVVMVRMSAANRDARKFPDPDMFDIMRENAALHVGFGFGAHACVGSLLARQEITSSFTALLDRLNDIALAEPLPDPLHAPDFWLRPIKRLQISFTAAS